MSVLAPMREAPLILRCDRCDQQATGRCLRCDRPGCDDHLPAEGRRCDRCEAELDRRLTAAEPAAIDADRYRRRFDREPPGARQLAAPAAARGEEE